jgi:hypothetical protein
MFGGGNVSRTFAEFGMFSGKFARDFGPFSA